MKDFLFTLMLVGILGACSSTDEVIDTPVSESVVSDSVDLVKEEKMDSIQKVRITKTPTHYSVSKPRQTKVKKENM